eukprot:GGOE01054099.1.p2 GENE.GGOE01054099.1~~GGOE01054099.1.p2  ORF type:complete len:368 (+),score=150.41 GGOE01054099.1:1627-2730(+)
MQALKQQLAIGNLMLKNLYRIQFDPIVSSRMSVKSFAVDFTGMVLYEGMTNPKLTSESVAERCLGKGNTSALQGKVALVTGGAGHLGFEFSRVLRNYGCHVVYAVLKEEAPALQDLLQQSTAPGPYTILTLDLGDLATIKPFVAQFDRLNLPLHYLVNNAGLMTPKEFRPSKQGYEIQFAVNHLGHFLLTELLHPYLKTAASKPGADVRVVTLSSVGSTLVKSCDLDKLIPPPKETYHGVSEYGISKAMNLLHSRELQKRFGPDNITCAAVHPGVIHTGLLRESNPDTALLYEACFFKPFHKNVPMGSATHMYCTVSPDLPRQVREGHCFFYNCAPQKALGVAAPGVRDDLPAKVWKISEDLVAPFR